MQDRHCELMQVANYGMGGHYTPHYDYLIVDRPLKELHLVPELDAYAGDRTATFMFYVSHYHLLMIKLKLLLYVLYFTITVK